ncbi:MAG TPA: LPS assembly lipoprotein LptE [Verrucomicrobiae bacterium]
MRALRILLSGLALAVLAGCAGYHLGSTTGLPAGTRSIEIQPFNNQTLQPRLGDALTQSVRERIQTDATYRLATREPGDVVVSGVIHQYLRQGLGFLSTDIATPENYRLDMVVHVTARDRSSGKLILDKEVRGQTIIHIGDDLASAERQAAPQLTEDVARNIVELLTEGAW